jgi:rhodanese-related sulfurtransferase
MSAKAVSDEISAAKLLAELRQSTGELALLDVREEGRFAAGHILRASSLPLSRLELQIAGLVPRPSCRIVLCDDDDGLSRTAAAYLRHLGYTDVVAVGDGFPGWVAAGGETFAGLNAPSKALGVFAQSALAIPEIEPEQLARLIKSKGELKVVDCRPFAEFQRGSIPGAVNCPGVELVKHMPEFHWTVTVVNCAGRTRGLLGAQTLIDFGFDRNVFALRDGTMGWELAGHDMERTASRRLDAAGLRPNLQEVAEGIRRQAGIPLLDLETVIQWCADPGRTTYVFDVRQASEYQAGHIAGARHVAGGQLIQNLDQHVATLGSRIVLADDDGVRATATALWLRRMGWREVAVVAASDGFEPMGAASGPPVRIVRPPDAATVSPQELKSLLERNDTLLIDLATSRDYRNGHIPGAWFVVRSRLPSVFASLPEAGTVVLTSEDGAMAAFASTDDIPFKGAVHALEGGTAAWRQAGYPVSTSLARVADVMDDVVLKPSELSEGRETAMRDYLSGSEGLLDKVRRDGTLRLTAIPIRW